MKTISIDEQKKISLSILNYVDELCKTNQIKYYIGYGTLLGAVRHKGFIPWDDDIDLIMFRKDYDRFVSIAQNNLRYGCLSFEDLTYHSPYTKIVDMTTRIKCEAKQDIPNLGVGIDIFPFDYFAEKDINVIYAMKKKLNVKEKMIRYSLYSSYSEIGKFRLDKYLFYLISRLHSWEYWAKKYKKIIDKYKNPTKASWCGVYSSMNTSIIPVFESSIFDSECELEFEGKKYPAPGQYVNFLATVYGDYMQLPPEEKRIPHPADAYYI